MPQKGKEIKKYERRYQPIKIEKLGDDAMKFVLSCVKKGMTYLRISELLNESYAEQLKQNNTTVDYRDVSKVMKSTAKAMHKFKDVARKSEFERANMVLNESTVMVEDMYKLESAMEALKLELDTTDFYKKKIELSKALSDVSRQRMNLVRMYKKLTGQFKESALVNIDQSNKILEVHSNTDASDKLARELAQATFKVPKGEGHTEEVSIKEKHPLTDKVENIVDVDYETGQDDDGDETKDEDDNIV